MNIPYPDKVPYHRDDVIRGHADYEYLRWSKAILDHGERRGDRTGTGTNSIFGIPQMVIDLQQGFPLLTTKKMALKSIIHELLWFIQGDTNLRYLAKNKVRIWDEWPLRYYLQETGQAEQFPEHSNEWKEKKKEFIQNIIDDETFAQQWGNLGPVYGAMWRSWPNPDGSTTDQLLDVIESLKKKPESRRHIISAWHVSFIDEMAKAGLPPCHNLFQFYVSEGEYLCCKLYQRSADWFLGVPFNIASYALLTMMMAQVTDLKPGYFVHTFGDAHVYTNHPDQVNEQLSREPRTLPTMTINPDVKNILDFTFEDFELSEYDPHEAIKAPIAI